MEPTPMAMPLIYDIRIEPAQPAGHFIITWKDAEKEIETCFQQSRPDAPAETMELWRLSLHQTEIGEKLFNFLNGTEGQFEKALNKSDRKETTLQLNLHTCKETTDWPFECLALKGEFLSPKHLHLVRQVSHTSPGKTLSPGTGVLKLLFMACSPDGAEPELDFDREEETIFQITGKLPIDVDIEDSGSLAGLRDRLRNDSYDVIYLSGIAGIDEQQNPYFVMEDEFGNENRVNPGQLWQETLMENSPRLLFLAGSNTAKSPGDRTGSTGAGIPGNTAEGSFARLMAESGRVPAVLGWGHYMIDAPAIFAAKILFKELSRGRSILDAVQRVRFELQKEFHGPGQGSWTFLRLYGDGATMTALVKNNQNQKPGPRKMKHIYLKNSWVKVLSEGFIGRRRPVQACLGTLINDATKIGLLITGGGGLGKSCLAGKISERFPNHTLIIIHGCLHAYSMEKALVNAFYISQHESARNILDLPLDMMEKLTALCSSAFKNKNYLFLLDDFEKNLENAAKGQPGTLLPEAKSLLTCLLLNLPLAGKQTQLIITSRCDFSLPHHHADLVEAHLGKIALAGFSFSENQKKLKGLNNLYNHKYQDFVSLAIELGCGNPRLLEWIDKLAEISREDNITSLLEKAKNKKEEFIEDHVLRELIEYGGKELTFFLEGLGIYRRPVPLKGVRQMAEGTGIQRWQPLLQKGVGLSLVEFDQVSKRYMVSIVVQDILLPVDGDYSNFHRIAFDYYRDLCDGKDNLDSRLAEEWIYHALGCGQEDTAVLQGARLVACMHRRLALRTAFEVGEWILSAKKTKSHTAADAFLFNEVAVSAYSLGEYHKSVRYYRDALAIDCELYGEEHPETALDLNNMGLALIEIKEYKDAIFCFHKALAIYKKLNGPIHATVAQTLNNLGSVYFARGNFQRAREFFEHALAIDLKVYGDTHPQTAISLNNVGEVLKRLDFFEKSIQYSLSALSIDRKVYGEEHPAVARGLTNIGTAYFSLGKFDTAVDYLNQAYIIFRTLHGRYSISLGAVLNSLGLAMSALKNQEKAIEYFEEALSIHARNNREEHPQVGVILNNLGEVWRNKRCLEKAEELFHRGLEIELKTHGEKHPDTAISLNNLGLVFYDRGSWKKALHFFKRSLSINKSVYGKEHTSIAGDYYNMAQVYEVVGEKEKAKAYFEKAYNMVSKFLPAEHPWVTSTRKKCQIK